MKAFSLEPQQIARVVAGLVADELSWRFKRHVDFLTVASWVGATALGEGGLGLSGEERAACARRVERFFGAPPGVLEGGAPVAGAAATVADWADRIGAAITVSLTAFSFTAAGRDSESESSTHAADEVFADAAAAANLLYGRRRLVSLVSPHGLLGFVVTVLTANLQGVPSIDARGMAPESLAATLAFGDVVVATPTLWRYLVSEGVRAPDNAMAVCFGEAMTSELAGDLRKAGFGALRELYGSTETGLVGWRDSPTEPFILFDCWRRSGEGLSRVSPNGQARATAPMDVVSWQSERSFRLAGRRDGAVQVGAVNVFPDRIAAVIRDHWLVEDCRIEVAPGVGGGNRLIARIKLKPGAVPSESVARDVDVWCRTQLRPQERPRIYNFEDDVGATAVRP